MGYHWNDKRITGGYIGGQWWMFNGWNLEAGLNRYGQDHWDDYKKKMTGWYVMTNTEFGFTDHIGFYGGLGYSQGFGENKDTRSFMVDAGLIIRLYAR